MQKELRKQEELPYREDQKEWIRILESLSNHESLEVQMSASRQAPAYLKKQILERKEMADVRAAAAVHRTSKKMQLFYYSLKTVAVVAASLLILFSISGYEQNKVALPQEKEHMAYQLTRKMNDGSSRITDFLSKFSYHVVRGF